MSKKDDALKLALEYRPTMDKEVLHSWATEMKKAAQEALAEQPAQQGVDWEKLYRLEVKKKEALAAKYERDTGKKLTRIVPMAEQPAQQQLASAKITSINFVKGTVEWLPHQGSPLQVGDYLYTTPQAQQQEPVGEAYLCDKCQTPFDGAYYCPECGHNTATKESVYTSSPAQRTWVGLTHEEHMEIMTGAMTTSSRMAAVEAKLKEKNT